MRGWQKTYYFGMLLAIILSVIGELIWLPDPIRLGNGFYWLDGLDFFAFIIVLVPLCWIVGALLNIFSARGYHVQLGGAGNKQVSVIQSRWRVWRSGAVCVSGALAVIAIITVPKQIEYSVGSLGIVWLLVFVDLFFSERAWRKLPTQSLTFFLGILCILAFLFWPTAYLVTYPGVTMNMNRYAAVNGGGVHGETSGVLVFERPAFPVDWVYAKLFPHYTFEPIEKLGVSLGVYNQQSQSMKADANAAGSAIAFQKLGLGKGITSDGVLLTAIEQSSPVQGILQVGDVIEQLNSRLVSKLQDLTDSMSVVKPGDPVDVLVRRGSKRLMLKTGTRRSTDNPSRAVFGVQVSEDLQYDIPEKVIYHNYLLHEGGPSHGAMLALTLIDQLTPSGVTYRNRVAGTGTIGQNGVVGPVGAVEQKAYTVNRAGADVFFVPVENEADARKGAPELQIVPVRSLDDILKWLRAHPK
ncbi:S16 family serine protease [Paenibacillus aestuarii]|uniref:S16 family serine protease n=1 Tax=Paenibacillus aestuarii TaxID=516965 RepID=A0ABW0K5M3_9BACL|nr:S16 family serine protease [Paenibacillus aestuarii]